MCMISEVCFGSLWISVGRDYKILSSYSSGLGIELITVHRLRQILLTMLFLFGCSIPIIYFKASISFPMSSRRDYGLEKTSKKLLIIRVNA